MMAPGQDTNEPRVRLTVTARDGSSNDLLEWFRPSDFQTAIAFATAVEERPGKIAGLVPGQVKSVRTRGFDENPLREAEPLGKIWRMAMAISAAFVTAECRSPEEAHDVAKNPALA